MYVGAFLLTWFWTVVSFFFAREDNGVVDRIFDYGQFFGLPSQGFFNALIFVYNKIHIACQARPNLTFAQALKMVVFTPYIAPEMLVSSLDVVNEDMHQREDNITT